VRDVVGNAIAGAHVLVLSTSAARTPLGQATTDRHGRFVIAGVEPGTYLVEADKDGYHPARNAVDTGTADIDVVLSAAGDERHDPSWALRASRRSMWHETAWSIDDVATAPRPDPLDLDIDQLFTVAPSLGDTTTASPAALHATETRARLTTRLGTDGALRAGVERSRLRAASTGGPARASGERERARAGVALELGLDRASTLDAHATVEGAGLAFAGSAAEGRSDVAGEHRLFDAGAAWTRTLATARVEVGVGASGGRVTSRTSTDHDAGRLTARESAAHGSVELAAAPGHEIGLGVRTRRVDVGASGDHVAGWEVDLDAHHTWDVRGPVDLEYGVGWRHDASSGVTEFVPTVGGVWEQGEWQARAALSYAAGRDALGYRAEIDLPLGENLRLVGSSQHDPSRSRVLERRPADALAGDALYVTDGVSATGETRVGVMRLAAGVRVLVEVAAGYAEGAVVPLGQLVPIDRDDARELRHRSARMGVHLAGTGTGVELAYRRLTATGATADDAALDRALELRVVQDLRVLRRHGDWRLLGAVHLGTLASAALDGWEEDVGSDAPIVALDRRLSAGIAFGF
jgi:hypothetical protein